MSEASLPAAYFDALYAGDPDPWRFRSSDYEREKYAQTVAALEGRRFARAVEIGCSIGELTARLAPLCDDLLGVDIAQAALDAAAMRNRETPQVHFQRLALPGEQPDGLFDLIVLSEVLYYFGAEDLKRVAAWVQSALASDGVVLAVHWLGETPDYPQTGDEAVEAFTQALQPALTTDRRSRQAQYRLDRLARRP
jgi:predicted TPR repeat methyltransferase